MIKQQALDCISGLPDNVTWDDIMYSIYVIQKVEEGRQEAREGKGLSIEEARKQLGLV